MGSNSVLNPVGKNFLGTGGTPFQRPLSAFGSGGLSEFTQKNPFGVPINNPISGVFGNNKTNPYISGPFALDPNQLTADQTNISNLGDKQYTDTLAGIDANTATQAKTAADFFKNSLPGIAENAQAAKLFDSTGYGQEVARQQSLLASQVASGDADKRLAALTGRQGFETGALQRGQSLEDFINSANVAKSIGASIAPQPPSAKQNFGTTASGIGALLPVAKAIAK